MLAGATIQNRATELLPRRTARCHAPANGGPRSVVRLFAHRSIASCDINVLPFTTHVNKAQTPLPTTNSALELEVIFCVQGVVSPLHRYTWMRGADSMLQPAKHVTLNSKSTYSRYTLFADDLVTLSDERP